MCDLELMCIAIIFVSYAMFFEFACLCANIKIV